MNDNGKLPIYIRLTVNGQRLEFSSKKFIEKAKWSSEMSKMKGNTEEAYSINSYLDMMRSKVLSAEMELLHKEEELSIENFQSILLEKNKNHRMLIPVFQDHNNKMKELLGKKYAPGTLQRFEVTLESEKGFSGDAPLIKVTSEMTHVSYSKGAVAMYKLSEIIGEDKVNLALRNFLAKHKYPALKPISTDFLTQIYKITDRKHHNKIKTLFCF